MLNNKNNSAQIVILLTVFSIISKALGLVRDSFIANIFGASAGTDVFFLSNTFIILLASLITQSINTTMIPLLQSISKDKIEERSTFTNNLLHVVIFCSILIIICGILLVKPLSYLVAPGFDEKQRSLFIVLTQIGFPCILFYSIAGVYRGYLQCEGYFLESAVSDFTLNITYILALFFVGQQYGVYVLTGSVLIASVFQLVVQKFALLRTKYRYFFVFNIKDEKIARAISMVPPILLSTGISDINKLIDKAMASTLPSGSLSALNYASKINTLFLGVFITSIITVLFPLISKSASEEGLGQFKEYVRKGIVLVLTIAIPAMVVLAVLGEPIVQVLFQRGAFDVQATRFTVEALIFYSMSLMGLSVRLIIIKAFYSLKDTKTPVISGIICAIINVILNLLLKPLMAHKGLALATAISSTCLATLLVFNLDKKINGIGLKKVLGSLLKLIFGSATFGAVVYYLYNSFLISFCTSTLNRLLVFILLGIIGVLIYFLVLVILRLEEISFFVSTIKGGLIRNKTKNI